MTQKFIPSMRKLFIDGGYDMKEDGDAAEHDSSFIVVVRGTIYPVFEDYSWDRDTRGIYYSGSGGDIALGAIEALLGEYKHLEAEGAEAVVRNAIAIASKWDIHTAEPIIVMTQYE
jgi:ATP-dependent protease HslVU (ClpYQ) peptidase subunit